MEMRIRVVEAPQNLVGHSKMPLLHHLQTVSPTPTKLLRPRPPRDNGKLATFQNRKLGSSPRRVHKTRRGRIVVGRESGAQIRMHKRD